MNIGISITSSQILLAVSEAKHFTILEKIPLSLTTSFTQIANYIFNFFPNAFEENVYISIPSLWSISKRHDFTTALHTAGINQYQYTLVPDCIAVLTVFQNQTDFFSPRDFLFITNETKTNERLENKIIFSFVSYLPKSLSPLWEGTFIGNEKFFRKIANSIGFLYKSKWSPHLTLAGDETVLKQLFSSSLKNFQVFFTQPETILQGITLYQPTVQTLLSHLHFRCHSCFYVEKEALNPSAKGTHQKTFLCSSPLVPLLWNDYNCLRFFTKIGNDSWELFHNQIWRLYEKPMYENSPLKKELLPLYSFCLTEPSGLWLSGSDGKIELFPFSENMPYTAGISFSFLTDQDVKKEISEILENLQRET